MASSEVMSSTSSATNTDLHPRPICPNLLSDPSSRASMNMDDLLKNLYPDPIAQNEIGIDAAPAKTVDEVWKEIVAGSEQRVGDGVGDGGVGGGGGAEEMTLEDFLTKAGAVREEEVRVTGYGGVDAAAAAAMGQFQVEGGVVGFRNGGVVVGGGRGKRRAVEEPPVDKATQQKQRRMIKNRESAARSRERKQAYTVELESLVTQLEEENARLRREEVEHNKERLKQLMETVIPVSEKRRPPRTLRRVNSMQW